MPESPGQLVIEIERQIRVSRMSKVADRRALEMALMSARLLDTLLTQQDGGPQSPTVNRQLVSAQRALEAAYNDALKQQFSGDSLTTLAGAAEASNATISRVFQNDFEGSMKSITARFTAALDEAQQTHRLEMRRQLDAYQKQLNSISARANDIESAVNSSIERAQAQNEELLARYEASSDELRSRSRAAREALARLQVATDGIEQWTQPLASQVDSARELVNVLAERQASIQELLEVPEPLRDEVRSMIRRERAALDEFEARRRVLEDSLREAIAGVQVDREAVASQAQLEFKQQLEEFQKSADTARDLVLKQAKSVESLAANVKPDAFALNFKGHANRQWWVGTASYALATVLLLTLMGVLAFELANVRRDQVVSWQYVSFKLALGLVIASAAAFAIRVGSKAWDHSELLKEMELELRALEPLSTTIDNPELSAAVRAAFMGRALGHWRRVPTATDPEADNQVLLDALEVFKKLQT